MTVVQFVADGAPATAALRARIEALKAADPFAAVTVAVPSNYAGLGLRRLLAKDGLVNVRFLVLGRAAELLGAPTLAALGRTPLTPALRAEAIRVALGQAPGVFAPVAHIAATERALDTTFRELRDLSEPALDALAARSRRAHDVVALFRAYRQAVAGHYDETDLAEAAATAVADGSPALRDLGHLVLHLPRRLSRAETAFVRALADRGAASVLLELTGDPDADAESVRIAAALGHSDAPPALPVPAASSIVVAPDTEEEARTAVRSVLADIARGSDLADIAILYPNNNGTYARVLHEQLGAAGIPFNGPAARTLAEGVPGRHLLKLLRLPDGGFSRADVMAWLTSAPVRTADGHLAPAARWDALSRAAQVVDGASWQQRLNLHMEYLRERQNTARDEGRESRVTALQYEIDQAQGLLEFVTNLQEQLQPGERRTWGEFVQWALDLQRRYLGTPGALEDGADSATADEAEQVEEIVHGLAPLDRFQRTVDMGTFRRTLEHLLTLSAGRTGSFGHGVFVGHLGAAAGLDFVTTYIVGLAEGEAPVRGADDPLLPSEEREAAGGELPPRERMREQRREFLGALASARRIVLSYARSDMQAQRQRLPSRWLLETAHRLAGRRILTEELPGLRDQPWLSIVDSFDAAIRGAAPETSAQELRLRRMRTPAGDGVVRGEHPHVGAGIAAAQGRASADLTRWDGLLDGVGGLAPTADQPSSPTRLEDWATCPMRYFLKSVLGIQEFEQPDERMELKALDRGNIIHNVLETFFNEVGERDSTLEWSDAERQRLREIAEEECRAAEAKGITGKPLLWKRSRERLLRDLDTFLDDDLAVRRFSRSRFVAAEHAFGDAKGEVPPVIVELEDGRSVAFRGKIDRVDRSGDGTLRVYDYKSGKSKYYDDVKKDIVDRGKRLQLPIYALAAQQAFGDDETPVEASYWFIDSEGKFERIGRLLGEADSARFREVLGRMLEGIESGVFPANPGDRRDDKSSYANCVYCPYDSLCPGGRDNTWERKQGAPQIISYADLATGPLQ